MVNLPKINQLRVFHEVIRCGSLRAAAKSLGKTQPAVTKTIRELENILSTSLMIRSSSGIELTDSGVAFSTHTQSILEELDKAVDEVKTINSQAFGRVAFGFSSLLSFTVLPDIINDFKTRNPQVNITLREAQLSSLLPALREGKIDFAIGSINPQMPINDFIVEPLFSAPFGIIAHKNHPLNQCTQLSELKDAKWLMAETDMGYYHSIRQQLAGIDIEHSPQLIKTDSVVSIFNLILKSDFLMILACAMSKPFNLSDELCLINVTPALPEADYGLIYRKGRPVSPLAQQLIEGVKRHCDAFNWSS